MRKGPWASATARLEPIHKDAAFEQLEQRARSHTPLGERTARPERGESS